MLRRRTCVAAVIDRPLPNAEQFRSSCLFAWFCEYPAARLVSHDIEISMTRVQLEGQPHNIGLIMVTIHYAVNEPGPIIDPAVRLNET